MYSKWTSHLKTPEEKDEFQKTVFGSKRTLDRLKGILAETASELDGAEVNPKTYDIPNWDYRQAHNNGFRQCLSIVKKLIDLDQQEIKLKE